MPDHSVKIPDATPRTAVIAFRSRDAFDAALGDTAWRDVPSLPVNFFHPRSGIHRPVTCVRMVHHGDALRVRFDVDDRFVIARATAHQQDVCLDSCVEMFIRPIADGPYFNFEFNCAGIMLCHCVEDWRRLTDGLARSTPLPTIAIDQIAVRTLLQGPIEIERTVPTQWWLEAVIPLAVMEPFVGPIGPLTGRVMTGNFFKCADECSQPHWASWSPIGERLNFHVPQTFGKIIFR